MIHQRLRSNPDVEVVGDHPDEDTICAFMEGRLEEAASSEMVSHLIVCSLCRRITAQSTRLESHVATEYEAPLDDAAPGRLRTILEDLAARVIPESQEDVVFAYQNPPETQRQEIESTPDQSNETDPD